MAQAKDCPPTLQPVPPLPPSETLPTMYDLPSEYPEGLPDEFHDLQPQLLSRTLRLTQYAPDNYFTGTDINVYYDSRHPTWHKRPDWFLAVDVPRLYQGKELRNSYVVWQGTFDGIEHGWLRWCDRDGNWLLTDTELATQQAEAETQRADIEAQRADAAEAKLQQVVKNLQQTGMDLGTIADIVGLSPDQLQQLNEKQQ